MTMRDDGARGRVRTAAILAGACALAVAWPARARDLSFSHGRFGRVVVAGAVERPNRVVILVSGDNGWDDRMQRMAESIAGLDTLVLGVDVLRYLRQAAAAGDKCTYAAADFESLSQTAQRRLGRRSYEVPVLAGYSSGATLVYDVLAQAPPGTFHGALSLGFCPDLPLKKPLCRGAGLTFRTGKGGATFFDPAKHLRQPWVALQGDGDRACPRGPAEAFAREVPGARVVVLPTVGHGFRKGEDWLPAFREAMDAMTRPAARAVPPSAAPPPGDEGDAGTPAPAAPDAWADAPVDDRDLPLVEVPAAGAGGAPADLFAVILTGDGGWANIDRDIGETLAGRGLPVVGWNSLKYYWTKRTPDEAAGDLAWILGRYAKAYGRGRAVLIGYSFGADVLPFLVNRLPARARERVAAVALLGPSHDADFEFHVSGWLGGSSRESLPTLPEAERLGGLPVLCLYGSEEHDSLCRDLAAGNVTRVEASGGHHLGGDYDGLARRILDLVENRPAAR